MKLSFVDLQVRPLSAVDLTKLTMTRQHSRVVPSQRDHEAAARRQPAATPAGKKKATSESQTPSGTTSRRRARKSGVQTPSNQ
jgi:hypothetical protein